MSPCPTVPLAAALFKARRPLAGEEGREIKLILVFLVVEQRTAVRLEDSDEHADDGEECCDGHGLEAAVEDHSQRHVGPHSGRWSCYHYKGKIHCSRENCWCQ